MKYSVRTDWHVRLSHLYKATSARHILLFVLVVYVCRDSCEMMVCMTWGGEQVLSTVK